MQLHFEHFLRCIIPCGQVFDGHGGTDAAAFVQKNILKFILDDAQFPICVNKAIKNAFARADHALADSRSLDRSSGTTALTALIFGRLDSHIYVFTIFYFFRSCFKLYDSYNFWWK